MQYININGRILAAGDAAVSYDNRAFRYGYGLFETMLVQEAVIRLETFHQERLLSGMQQLHFSMPKLFSWPLLQEQIMRTVRKNGLAQLCRVRLQVYAGPGGVYETNNQPQYIIECFPLEKHVTALNENGLVTGIATGLQKSTDSLANLKSCNALIYAVAAQQATGMHWNDALICNTNGHIIESTIANIFWIKDNIVYTPPLQDGCVAGVMRRYLLETLPGAGFTITEKSLTPGILADANEVLLTNALRGIKWVKETAGTTYTCRMARDIAGIAQQIV